MTADSVASAMAEAGKDLLEHLRAEQRAKILLPIDDQAERETWYYTPTPRLGVPIFELEALQRQKLRRLLASGLSADGYNAVAVIMGVEAIVDSWTGFPDRNYGDLPNTRLRDPQNYFAAIYGQPGEEGWGWRVGGHHVGVHFTVRNGVVSPTPAFLGVEPSYIEMPGNIFLRPLAAEEDLARKLLGSLDPNQLGVAVIAPVAPFDIVQANRPAIEADALPWPDTFGIEATNRLRQNLGITDELDTMVKYTLQPKGLPYSAMSSDQQQCMVQLITTYFDRVKPEVAAQYADRLQPSQLENTTFSWAGPVVTQTPSVRSERRPAFYYRVQGERLLIEFDNAQNDTNHAHSVWRDPSTDFGRNVLAEHYALHHAAN
jgi:hypothetical protein